MTVGPQVRPLSPLSPASQALYRGPWVSPLTGVLVKMLVAQSCPTLGDPMDRSPSGSSVHGILQARILEWVAIPFSRGSSRPKD